MPVYTPPKLIPFHDLPATAPVLYCGTCDYISRREELNPKYPEARCPHCAKILEGMTKGEVMAKRDLKRPHTTPKKKGTK
jgi:DNA-directed RNA polymerase subunit RPC12/RpoP